MTHPFLFHPRRHPGSKRVPTPCSSPCSASWTPHPRGVAAPRAGQRGVSGRHDAGRHPGQASGLAGRTAAGQGQEIHLYCFQVPHRRGAVVAARAGVSAAMPPREQHFRFNSHHQPPAWVQDQVFYQIFPDRFCNGDPSLSVKHHEYEYRARRSSARPGASRSAATKRGTAPVNSTAGIWRASTPSCTTCNPWGDGALPQPHLRFAEQPQVRHPGLLQGGCAPRYQCPVCRADPQPAPARHEDHPGCGGQPHLHRAPLVLPTAGRPEQPGLPWRSFYTFDQEGDYVSWKGSAACPSWISQVNRCRTPFIGQTTPFCATGCAPLPDRWLAL